MDGYRYGFNGKENDNEVKGEGNQQDYGMRVYDPRLGKFLSVDPLTKEYPELTPYQFSGNTPIQATDLDGAETFIQRQGNATRRYAEIKIAKAEQIRIQSEKWKYPEPHILLADIYGNGHMGPESIVRQNVAAIKNEHDDAVGAAIAAGPFGAVGYSIWGDKGAFIGSGIDGGAMSVAGIPEEKSRLFPKPTDTRPTPFIPKTEAPTDLTSSGLPRVYRVEGGIAPNASHFRILESRDGTISIKGNDFLHVNIDDGAHAVYFYNKRGGQKQGRRLSLLKYHGVYRLIFVLMQCVSDGGVFFQVVLKLMILSNH
ncbi:RHS repeat domain-containing protein [Chitinophaga sp. CF418]|uniref:RHS repeat domain-containing protein n=1 Tax=Chitinophaga sp. CF418 TaxID=1855287 RepID=UPI000917DA64|nr:RHS repeat-associated core domain-containing protein [Chitinophaga sp. CF418]SHN08130.1 RHS repeat-associated core domain-containing protein [Chitinophaga sp. CF418]